MADIELVIKIPEKTYKDIQSLDWKIMYGTKGKRIMVREMKNMKLQKVRTINARSKAQAQVEALVDK